MNSTSRLGMRLLKAYVIAAATLLVVGTVFTWRQPPATRFEEIDVERMNVVEKDGSVRLVVSNKARFPGLMINGEEHPYPRGVAGIVFIDDTGTEFGALTTHTRRAEQDFGAYSGLQFGNVAQGQTIGMLYDDDAGQRKAGLFIRGASADGSAQLLERGRTVQQMPEGPAKVRAMAELRRAEGPSRISVARMKDESAAVALSDPEGNPRLRLVVDAAGAPRLEFLDASGNVTRSLQP